MAYIMLQLRAKKKCIKVQLTSDVVNVYTWKQWQLMTDMFSFTLLLRLI